MILDTNALSAWAEGLTAVETSFRTATRLVVSVVLGEYYFRQMTYGSRLLPASTRFLC